MDKKLVVVTFVYADDFLHTQPFAVSDIDDLARQVAEFRKEFEQDQIYIKNQLVVEITEAGDYRILLKRIHEIAQ